MAPIFELANHLACLSLELAGSNDGRPLRRVIADLAAPGAGQLQSLDDLHRLVVGNLAEDDVAAIEPRGDDGGDEELGAVAALEKVRSAQISLGLVPFKRFLRVLAGIGHGQKAGLVVPQLEVLIGKLLAVDGLAAGALGQLAWTPKADRQLGDSHVAAGKVTALEHEVRDDAVEAGAAVAETVLASAELPEVAGGLRDNVVEEVEDDTALLLDCAVPKSANGRRAPARCNGRESTIRDWG